MINTIDIIKSLVQLEIDVTIKNISGKIVASLNTGAKSDLYLDLENQDPSKLVVIGRYEYINQDINIYEDTTTDEIVEELASIVLYKCTSSSGFIANNWLHLAEHYDYTVPDNVVEFMIRERREYR